MLPEKSSHFRIINFVMAAANQQAIVVLQVIGIIENGSDISYLNNALVAKWQVTSIPVLLDSFIKWAKSNT